MWLYVIIVWISKICVNSVYKQHALSKVFSASSNDRRAFIALSCGVKDLRVLCAMLPLGEAMSSKTSS